jgi:mycothiol synthase
LPSVGEYLLSMTNGMQTPTGYTATVGGAVDTAELAWLLARVESALDGSPRATESFVQMVLDAPGVQPEEGTLSFRHSGTRDLVGFGLYQNAEPHVESVTSGWVRPDHRDLGLGSTLVGWGLQLARSHVGLAPDGSRVTNRCQATDADFAAAEVFTSLGYKADRHDIELELVFDGPVTVSPFPHGLTVRTMSGADDIPTVSRVVAEAFKDHYGWVESSVKQRIERWENFRAMDEWDDDLVFIAESDGEAVAVLVGIRSHGSRTDLGYIGSLGVVRSWRGRGIAKALLTTAFDQYHRRGKRAVALDVDADSLTGATMLYRGVGMEPVRSETAYIIELRPGTDLVRR